MKITQYGQDMIASIAEIATLLTYCAKSAGKPAGRHRVFYENQHYR